MQPTSAPKAADDAGTVPGDLTHSASVVVPSLQTVVAVSLSPDGKFAYAASYSSAAVTAFTRDAKTGGLETVQVMEDAELLNGVTCFRISPNGQLGVATSFRSQTVVLFERDTKTGAIVMSDIAREGQGGVSGLVWVIDAAFSPDSQFVYAIADRSAAVTAFRVTDQKNLEFIEANVGERGCFVGARGIAVSPDGKFIYVVADRAGTLVVLQRDATAGTTTVKQIIEDGQGNVRGLAGAFAVACSPDGKFVYTSAGRFRGDHAIGVYKRTQDGSLELEQELINDTEQLKDFVGGNEIVVSPDGRHVYACASRSHALACFQRDSKTGRLTRFRTLLDSDPESGILKGVSGLAVSPDGKHVYAAAEADSGISIYKRNVR
jgi:6-phosphogluconolactonase (cycloisomerase 2 family)